LYKSLALMDTLPATPERNEQRLDTLLNLGDILVLTDGFTAPGVEAAFSQARELCQVAGTIEKRFLALRGLRIYWMQRGDLPVAAELSEEMVRLAEQMQDSIYLVDALRNRGGVLYHQANFKAAYSHYERASAYYKSLSHGTYFLSYEHDSSINGFCR